MKPVGKSGRYAAALVVAAVVAVVAISVLKRGGVAPRPGQSVRVAVISTSQGVLARQGEMLRLGAQLKAEEINAAGGVGGQRLDLLFFEGGCDAAQAKAAVKRVAADPSVMLILGPLCSGATEAVEEPLGQTGLAAITPTASAQYLVHRSPVVFRMVPSDGRQAELMALYAAREMGINRAGIIYEAGPFGDVARQSFRREAAREGLSVVGERPYPQEGAPLEGATQKGITLEQALREMDTNGAEALFLAGDAAMGAVVARAVAKMGLDLSLLGTSLMADRDLLEMGGEAVEGFTIAEPLLVEPTEPTARDFLERFQKRFAQRPGWIAASAYDALGVGAAAIELARGNRAAVRRKLSAMNIAARGYDGLTGLTFFDSWGGNQRPVRIVRVENGAFVPATAQFRPRRLRAAVPQEEGE